MLSMSGCQMDVEIASASEQHQCGPAGGDIKGTPPHETAF